jgi:hypothetical protein
MAEPMTPVAPTMAQCLPARDVNVIVGSLEVNKAISDFLGEACSELQALMDRDAFRVSNGG